MRRDCWGFFPRKYRLVSLATWFKRRRGKIPQSLKILMSEAHRYYLKLVVVYNYISKII
jgi:sugar-specific transcriptional regulator TrmB